MQAVSLSENPLSMLLLAIATLLSSCGRDDRTSISSSMIVQAVPGKGVVYALDRQGAIAAAGDAGAITRLSAPSGFRVESIQLIGNDKLALISRDGFVVREGDGTFTRPTAFDLEDSGFVVGSCINRVGSITVGFSKLSRCVEVSADGEVGYHTLSTVSEAVLVTILEGDAVGIGAESGVMWTFSQRGISKAKIPLKAGQAIVSAEGVGNRLALILSDQSSVSVVDPMGVLTKVVSVKGLPWSGRSVYRVGDSSTTVALSDSHGRLYLVDLKSGTTLSRIQVCRLPDESVTALAYLGKGTSVVAATNLGGLYTLEL